MSTKTLTVKVVGNDAGAKRTLDSLGHSAHKTGGMFGELRHHAGMLVAGFVGFEAIHKGAEFLKEATHAAKEDQTALALLANQANRAGVSWKTHGEEIEENLTKMSKTNGFMKADLIGSMSTLITKTKDQESATRMLNDAQNIARAKHMDLAAASKVEIKASMGNVGALKKLGIEVAKVTTNQDMLKKNHDRLVASGHKLSQAEKEQYAVAMKDAKAKDKQATAHRALAQIHKAYAGAATAYNKTAQGQLDKLSAQWELIKVAVGSHILPVLGRFAAFLTDTLPKGFSFVSGEIKEHIGLLHMVARALELAGAAVVAYMVVTKAVAAAQAIYRAVAGAIFLVRNAQMALNVAMELNPIGVVVALLIALGAAFYLAYTRSATFRNIVDTAFGVVKHAAEVALGWITKTGIPAVIGAWNSAQPVVQALAKIVKLHFDAIKFAIQTAVNIIKPLLHGDFSGALHAAETAAGKVATKVKSVMTDIPGYIEDAWPIVKTAATTLGGKILSGVESGVGDIGGWLLGKMRAAVNYAIDHLNSALHVRASFDPHIPGMGKIGVDFDPPDIPHLAKGGIVRGPQLIVAGDNRTRMEAVIPLDSQGRMPNQGNTFIIQHAPPEMNVRTLAAAIAWQQKSVPA